MDGKKQVNQ
jgi:hypothetical protein